MGVFNPDNPENEWIIELVTQTYRENLNPVEFGFLLQKELRTRRCSEQQLRLLATTLLRFATATDAPEKRLLICLVNLAKAESRLTITSKVQLAFQLISWARFIKVIYEFKQFTRFLCVEALADILRDSLPYLKIFFDRYCKLNMTYNHVNIFVSSCKSCTDNECEVLAKSFMDVLSWCLLALEQALQMGDERSITALARCACEYARNKFIRASLFLYERISRDSPSYIIEGAANFAKNYTDNIDIEILKGTVLLLQKSPVERVEERLTGMVKQPHPAVLTIVSVFESFRTTKRVDQMADAFFETAEILSLQYPQMFEDMLRGSLLIMVNKYLCITLPVLTLDVKESVSEEMVAFQSFFYLKLPQIIKNLLRRGVPQIDLLTALQNICACKALLNKSNTLSHFLEQLFAANVIDEGSTRALQEHRLKLMMESCPILYQNIMQSTVVSRPVILEAESAKIAVDKLMRQSNDGIINVLRKLACGNSGLFTFDSVCASFCADGNLTYFSSKLATINGQSERPIPNADRNEGYSRALAFNLSFILLTRIRFNYNDLRPSELVNGTTKTIDNTRSCFFKFASNYGWTAADCCGQRAPIASEVKNHYHERVNMLKHGQIFWDKRTVNYTELVDAVPIFGEILLDECSCKRPEEQEHFHEVIKKVLQAFCDDTNFMIVCLVQWMCSQPVTEARQNLVKSFIYALSYPPQLDEMQQERLDIHLVPTIYYFLCTVVMALTSAACRRTLEDLLTCDRLRDPRFTWIINCAKRKLPAVPFTMPAAASQSSDAEMLKQAFTYARQQGWASPSVLQLVDRCNKAGVVENWCMVWLSSMFKLVTNDEMVAAGELCFAAGVLAPVPCMINFARELTNYVLEQNIEFGCIEPKALVSASFLVHCLQLAFYSYWRLQKEKALRTDSEGSDVSDVGNPVEQSVEVIFSKFLRETRSGQLKSTIVFIYHFMVALASAPRNEPTKRIIELIPQELMYNLAQIDPRSFNLDLYLHLTDLGNETLARSALRFNCLLRKLGVTSQYHL
uniref:Mediator of RNA polymerase II transcription subunit 24 n=1 Tax=Syphacia muris TaxID=451379 RepID=A0A0N5AS96_9BILA